MHGRQQGRVLVVGAGFAGAVLAERIASRLQRRVLVIDRREHVAGNAHDERDAQGVLVHRYGPHLFHTNSARVIGYLSRFTAWLPYEHRVLANVEGRLVPLPVNLDTIAALYELQLDAPAMEAWLAARAVPIAQVRTAEEAVLSRLGRDLYERLFRGYTTKQWGCEPSALDASVTARIPVRCSHDDRYFSDSFQALPADGYTAMFERILDHPLIELALATDFEQARDQERFCHTVFTGPIDSFFQWRFGKLPYRSLRFAFSTHATPDGRPLQPVGQINHPDRATPFTRVTEFRHFGAPAGHRASTIAHEYPCATGEPYYPIPSPSSRRLYRRYAELAAQRRDVTFAGRLARYQYLNMDQVVAQALKLFAERAPLIASTGSHGLGIAA